VYYEVPILTVEACAALESPLPPLPVCLAEIQPHAFASEGDGESAVVRLAESEFDGERTRSKMKSTAQAVLTATQLLVSNLSEARSRLVETRNHSEQLELVTSTARVRLLRLAHLPTFVALLFWLLLFGASVFAELKNAIFLVSTSGLDFDGDLIGAACFCFVYVSAPLVFFKFVERGLSGRGRQRSSLFIKGVGFPIALGGLLLFAWTIGGMQDEVDLFADPSESFTPPFWMVMGSGMLLLVLCVMILPVLIRSSLEHLGAYQVRESPMFAAAATRIVDSDMVRAELEARCIGMRALIDDLAREREAYVAASVAELQRCRIELQAKRAQVHLSK